MSNSAEQCSYCGKEVPSTNLAEASLHYESCEPWLQKTFKRKSLIKRLSTSLVYWCDKGCKKCTDTPSPRHSL